jgi:hypothetical protein
MLGQTQRATDRRFRPPGLATWGSAITDDSVEPDGARRAGRSRGASRLEWPATAWLTCRLDSTTFRAGAADVRDVEAGGSNPLTPTTGDTTSRRLGQLAGCSVGASDRVGAS